MLKISTVVLFIILVFIQKVAWSSEKDLYDFLWLDPDKSVFVLQKRVYKKQKGFELRLDGLRSFNNEFVETYGLNLGTSYYFSEMWGVEVFGTYFSNSNNSNHRNVEQVTGLVPFLRRFNQAIGVNAIWSPFYGKINTFNKIYYFDWYFGFGLSSISAESNLNSINDPNTNRFDDETLTGVNLKTGAKVHLGKRHFLNIELRNFTYQAKEPSSGSSEKMKNYQDLLIGFGVKF